MKKIKEKRPLNYVSDTNIRKRPLAFYDLEFSGLDFDHEILQMGCVLVSQPDLKVKRKWKIQVAPEHIENADKTALEIIGYSEYKPEDSVPLREALLEFNKIAEGATLVGFNSVWDFLFLKKAYHKVGVKPSFHWQHLDVLSMAFHALYKKKKIKGFRMKELVKHFKIESGKWHDALEDARLTYEIFMKLRKHKIKK